MTLDRVRVVGGRAPQGGGIATAAGGADHAHDPPEPDRRQHRDGHDDGRGRRRALRLRRDDPVTSTVTDSTFFNNSAGNGGGVAVDNNGVAPPLFRGVTIAANNARAVSPAAGSGGVAAGSARVTFQGSILTAQHPDGQHRRGPVSSPANCADHQRRRSTAAAT